MLTSVTWLGVFGVTLAQVFGGPLCDLIIQYMSKRSGGVYEPEFRLLLMIPAELIGIIGYFGFGWSIEENNK